MKLINQIKYLIEKAKRKSKDSSKFLPYHPDYTDLETWEDIINYLFDIEEIENNIKDNVFINGYSEIIFDYLNTLPVLDSISEPQVVDLGTLLTETFNLIVTNKEAKKVIDNLKKLKELIQEFRNNIPEPDNQVSLEEPEIEEPVDNTNINVEEPETDLEVDNQDTEDEQEPVG